jgi:hypothetical protein
MHHHQQPIHAVHFAHPEERHIPPVHHQLPPYHLIPNTPVHHQVPQHQMTLLMQPPHHLHQPPIHPSYGLDYMPYEPIHQQHMQPMPTQHYEITYVRTTPENPPPVHSTPISAQNGKILSKWSLLDFIFPSRLTFQLCFADKVDYFKIFN